MLDGEGRRWHAIKLVSGAGDVGRGTCLVPRIGQEEAPFGETCPKADIIVCCSNSLKSRLAAARHASVNLGGKNMVNPILVTGAAGRVGAVGRTVTELLLRQRKAVRAMVRNEDERAQALRDMGAEVVVGDLLDLDSMHRVIAGCETMYFSMSISDAYLAATVNAAAVARHHGVKAFINMSQMTVSQMSITETTPSPQHKLQWLSEQALNPQPHLGKIYHLTGPQSENMHFYAQEYSQALGRTITYQDIPVGQWRDGLLKLGLPVHLVNHLATMADP